MRHHFSKDNLKNICWFGNSKCIYNYLYPLVKEIDF